MKAKKRFGQHFLVSGSIAERIAASADLTPDDRVLEIGPGNGVLTDCLLRWTPHVTAVEIDRDLFPAIEERFGGLSEFRLVRGDILDIDIPALFRGFPGRIKVVSNLPYNISVPIVDILIRNRSMIDRAVLMVQREVARRFSAAPGSRTYGLVSLNLGICARSSVLFDVRPGSFHPPPAVMSSVMKVEFDREPRFPGLDEVFFRVLTGAAFRHRRKMVRNTLIPHLVSLGIDEMDSAALLGEAGIDPTARPETLSVGDFVRLTGLATVHPAVRGR